MSREKNLETILIISAGLLVFYFIFNLKILVAIALLLSIIGLFLNYIAGIISNLWLKLAQLLGFISSKILLTLVFFVFLFPIALLSRLFRKTTMHLKRKTEDTYYFTRDYEFSAKDFENAW